MRKRAEPLATRDWAGGLPPELLGCVLDRLAATDHVRFASVCASWRSAVKQGRVRRPAPLAPCVLLRPPVDTEEEEEAEDEDEEEDTHGAFHLMRPSDGKIHTVRRPLPPDFHWKRLVGVSPDGCVVLVNKRGDLRALNPVTGARLRLPRVATIPKGYPKKCAKVVMSSPYASGSGAAVFMAFFRNRRQKSAVALARAGDKRWSLLDTAALAYIYDLANHEGAFYILGKTCAGDAGEEAICVAVVACGGRDLSSPPEVMMVEPKCPLDLGGHRLVGTASGDLLLVYFSGGIMCRCCRLDVLSDVDGGRVVRLLQLRDLGDQALLLGRECSMLVSTLQVPELRRNCVYSILTCHQQVFNLEDGSIETRPVGWCVEAAWFMPGVL